MWKLSVVKVRIHIPIMCISAPMKRIKKQNAKIKIEKIRDLLPFVQQTVDGWRVIVIEPAEALNIASSNALLKTLEEPGDRIVIILLADHYLKLPATIRSRLQHFALDRINAAAGYGIFAAAFAPFRCEQTAIC